MKGSRHRRLDLLTLVGIPLGVGLVLWGQTLEGGNARSTLQATAAVIVFGGTLGAVLVSFTLSEVLEAGRAVRRAFFEETEPPERVVASIVHYAKLARKDGILALEDALEREPDPLLKKGLSLAVDGIQAKTLRDMLEIEIAASEEREIAPSRVWDSAGGYAPTIGILGAVLGLIHVMENLSDPSRLGAGIAVAFVATVYGVGSANLLFLPLAAKLRSRAHAASRRRELVLEGIIAIQDGLNPRLIDQKLRGILGLDASAAAPQRAGSRAA